MASDQEHAKAAVKSIASALGIEDLEFNPEFIRIGPITISWSNAFWGVTAPFKYLPEEAIPFRKSTLPEEVWNTATATVVCSSWPSAVDKAFEMILCQIVQTILEAEQLAQKLGIVKLDENLN